ncbi:nuclear transport factor 2 family protein [Actinoplanes couchii]|uniref:SnoaL-like domain-containing protein n=1 Tax=Actinoplanes couchii TaxID=403638 RepID=A0ABQ3XL27_9ACTN|nr:nuclear transport factor 2 family protein [Actinoplanes couchii]MDR6319429.1 hypothetical protein [Actinoplanes couchii]GID59180.1 hypothetical protein Aco03nite_075840 [Actinoplanes couchii]
MNAIETWRTAGETRNADLAVTALTPDVTLISPITEQFVFRGRDQVHNLLEVALSEIDDLTYTDQAGEGPVVALFYEARIGATRIFEAQRLRLSDQGEIEEITLYVRPLPALTLLMNRLGPELARRNNQPALARLVPLAGGALHAMATSGERTIMPRVAPRD